jgi:cation:H+ antiporter
MLLTVVLLIGSAVVIYLSCEAFVNGVEWVGHKFKVSETATGTILAAFGTALPESVVTLVATAFGANDHTRQIGVGAALGGPLALSTIAYGVVGLALLGAGRRLSRGRNPTIEVDGRRLSRDQAWFLAIFAAKIALGLVVFAFKPWLGLAFLAAYGVYTWRELRTGEAAMHEDDLGPLLIRRKAEDPHVGWALTQTIAALVVIFAASHLFVGQLGAIGPVLGLSPQVTALLLSPIATELPETMNALIWVRQGKERLALANISGAMMIQATVPTAFGLFFTPWRLDRPLLLSGAITAVAVVVLLALFRHGQVRALTLSSVAGLYAVFAILLWMIGAR